METTLYSLVNMYDQLIAISAGQVQKWKLILVNLLQLNFFKLLIWSYLYLLTQLFYKMIFRRI